jgi:hypothetical protein
VQSADSHDQYRSPGDDQVYGITTAETSHTEDITRRQKQYILTMLIRVVSIVVVVFVPGISWPVKIGLCVAATIIPYVAVIRANGGPTPDRDPTNLMIGPPQRAALGSAQPGLPAGTASEEYLRGEYVSGERAHGECADGERAFEEPSDVGHMGQSEVSQNSMKMGADTGAGPAARPVVDQGADQAAQPR